MASNTLYRFLLCAVVIELGCNIAPAECGTFTTAVPVYETRAAGPYAFLNSSKWLATGDGLGAGVVNMTIYEAK